MTQEKQLYKYFLYPLAILLACSLSSCSRQATIPVVDRSVEAGSNIKNTVHVVEPGDTLFSIAWRYDLDYKQMAVNNGIAAPYTIHPGQEIRLDDQRRKVAEAKPVVKSRQAAPVERKPAKKADTTTASPRPSSPGVASSSLEWRWPASGRLIARFSTGGVGNKGIDIAGNEGDPVYAAEAGRVVYAGDKLVGYGNLIIIKHNDEYLSAYAHSRKMKVKEGDQVTRGQKIAEIGSTGTNKTKLHFEIRRRGKPLDPLQRLPKRP